MMSVKWKRSRFSMKSILAVFAIAFIAISSSAGATSYSNITVWDRMGPGSDNTSETGWPFEDNEVEPGNVQSQIWDLEAVVRHDNSLTLVGGWHFIDGASGSPWISGNFRSGDLFLAVGNEPLYGPDAATATGTRYKTGTTEVAPSGYRGSTYVKNNFGYSYVLAFNWKDAGPIENGTAQVSYDVYGLADANLELSASWFSENQGANPYKYLDGGILIDGAGGTATFNTFLTDQALTNHLGGLTVGTGWGGNNTHYTLTIDNLLNQSWLQGGDGLWTHFTQECGNDSLMGYYSDFEPVPEPISMVMLGCLGAGMLGARKLRRKESK